MDIQIILLLYIVRVRQDSAFFQRSQYCKGRIARLVGTGTLSIVQICSALCTQPLAIRGAYLFLRQHQIELLTKEIRNINHRLIHLNDIKIGPCAFQLFYMTALFAFNIQYIMKGGLRSKTVVGKTAITGDQQPGIQISAHFNSSIIFSRKRQLRMYRSIFPEICLSKPIIVGNNITIACCRNVCKLNFHFDARQTVC